MTQPLLLLVFASLLLTVSATQCAKEDDPMCPYWVENGFCTAWGFPQSMLQEYCPFACANSGCASTTNTGNCPPGFYYTGPIVNNTCQFGDVNGSVCCYSVGCEGKESKGVCTDENLCPNQPGYACDPIRRWCCPKFDPENNTVPGVCAEKDQKGKCPDGKGCAAGYECNTIAEVCCPFTTPVVVENVNCAKWNQDPNIVFCASAPDSQKSLFCPATCVKDINPTDDCIQYRYSDNDPYTTSPMMSRTYIKLDNTYAEGGYSYSKWRTFNKLLYIFVRAGFSMELYSDGTSYMNHEKPVATYSGQGSSRWFKIEAKEEQESLDMQCKRN